MHLVMFLVAFFILIKSAAYCTTYASRLAKIFRISEFIVSFFIIAVISVFPEATISIISALKGMPQLGLGTLFGSNIADLTFVFGVVALFSYKGIHVKSEILKRDFLYLLLLLFPVLLGYDGSYSRIDGTILVAGGLFFFYTISLESKMFRKRYNHIKDRSLYKNVALLLLSLVVLIISANYTIQYGVLFATDINIPAILISVTVIALGSCLPELFFSIKAVRINHDGLALGDILGTVITDATIILGIVALIQPFSFEFRLISITGFFMVLAGLLTLLFVRTDRLLTKKEGLFLLLVYIVYLFVELLGRNPF